MNYIFVYLAVYSPSYSIPHSLSTFNTRGFAPDLSSYFLFLPSGLLLISGFAGTLRSPYYNMGNTNPYFHSRDNNK
jgi:hypothetical protein